MKIGEAQRRGTTVNWGGVAILRQTISMAEIPSGERPRPRSQYLRLRRGEIVGSGYWVEPLAADPKACVVHYRAGRILRGGRPHPGVVVKPMNAMKAVMALGSSYFSVISFARLASIALPRG